MGIAAAEKDESAGHGCGFNSRIAFWLDLVEAERRARLSGSVQIRRCYNLVEVIGKMNRLGLTWALNTLLLAGTSIVPTAAAQHDYDALGARCSTGDRPACDTLISIATAGRDRYLRMAAVLHVNDQSVLAKLASEDADDGVRKAALQDLTDQAALARVATGDADPGVRKAALSNLRDQAVIAALAGDADWDVRTTAVIKLDDSNPALGKIAGDTHRITRDARETIVRIKLATQEAHIKSRMPGLKCAALASEREQLYELRGLRNPFAVMGESVIIKLVQSGTVIAEGSWSTAFPPSLDSGSTKRKFLAAVVAGEELMKRLFQLHVFTTQDLAELARSSIPEVRMGAVTNLADQATLAMVAAGDECAEVRKVAGERLTGEAAQVMVATKAKRNN